MIREINGQRSDEHGRFLLSATGCYWVRQPQNTVPGARNLLALEPATLQIGNDCGPCCVCDDYVRVYKGLRRVWQTYKEIGQRAVATRDQLALNILRFEESKACRQNRILSVQALPHNGNKVELLAAVCNASGDCTLNVELRLRVTVNNQKFPPDLPADALAPTVDCGSVLLSGDRGLEPSPIALVDGAYVGFWDYVDPGQQSSSTRASRSGLRSHVTNPRRLEDAQNMPYFAVNSEESTSTRAFDFIKPRLTLCIKNAATPMADS